MKKFSESRPSKFVRAARVKLEGQRENLYLTLFG
jgi:hypothetical protein